MVVVAGDEAGRVGRAVAAEEAGVGDDAMPSLACAPRQTRDDLLEDEEEDVVA